MNKYLLDTNICVYLLRGRFQLNQRVKEIGGLQNCCISEITVAELKYGDSYGRLKGRGYASQGLERFLDLIDIIPISESLDLFATEKARLRIEGTPVADNFDLLIGCTAIMHNCICVTENIKDFKHLKGIKLENWILRE